MHLHPRNHAFRAAAAWLCAALLVGCHGNPNTSGFGVAWVTLTDQQPAQYAAYTVTVDSVTLTRNDGAVVTAVGTPEIVDLTTLHNISELWSSGAIPEGIYTSASITLDYTNAQIAVLVNGVPSVATVLDYATGKPPTTYAITVDFDPQHELNITPTYASTSAALVALDIDLAASGRVALASTPIVYVRPFMTIGYLPDDNRLIRVRGPLINSSTDVDTYTVYIRPFYDEANNIGTVTLFSQPTTVYTLNGVAYRGSAGLAQLSQLSAGTTVTAGYTTFQPDYNPLNGAVAGRFNLVYMVGGSTLEDVYTESITGDVISRSGNTVTLIGSTLILNTANTFTFEAEDAQVLLGPGTIVTADDNSALSGLSSESIAVGQRITVRGILPKGVTSPVFLDATGTSSKNTGSVRIQPSELWGSLVSTTTGSLTMNASFIDNFPISDFKFAGNGQSAAQTPNPAAFSVTLAGLALPVGTAAGGALWVDGYSTPFGSAPPDFRALAVNDETSVQVAGGQLDGGAPLTPGTGQCGVGSQVCDPAVLQVIWDAPAGSTAPFESHSTSGFSINLADAKLFSAIIMIGPESIDMKSLPASPQIVPASIAATQTFAPRFAWGSPSTATTTASATATTAISVSGDFSTFISGAASALTASNPALELAAKGVYNRTTNTFTATSVSFVL